MIPVILKANTSAEIALALAADADVEGKTLTASFCGVMRTYAGLHPGDTLVLSFDAEETATFPLGTSRVFFVMSDDSSGEVYALPWAKIKVTDSPTEVSEANAEIAIAPRGALAGVEPIGTRWNESDMRDKVNEIIRRLGGTVLALALLLLPAFGDILTVQTAPKGQVYNDEQIVTNVQLDASGIASADEVQYIAQRLEAVAGIVETNIVVTSAVVTATGDYYWTCDWNGEVLTRSPAVGPPVIWYGSNLYRDPPRWKGSTYDPTGSWVWTSSDGEMMDIRDDSDALLSLDFGNGITLTRGGYTLVTNYVPKTATYRIAYMSDVEAVSNYVDRVAADKLDAPHGIVSGYVTFSEPVYAPQFVATGSRNSTTYGLEGISAFRAGEGTAELSFPDSSGTFATKEWVAGQLAGKADAERTEVLTNVVVTIDADNDWWTCDWDSVTMQRLQQFSDPHYLAQGRTLYHQQDYGGGSHWWRLSANDSEIGSLPYDANAITLDFGNGYTLTRGGYTLVTNYVPQTVAQSVMYSSGGNISIHATTDPDGVKRYRLYDND